MRISTALGTILLTTSIFPACPSAADIVVLRKIGIDAETVVLQLSAQTRFNVLPVGQQLVVDLADTRNRANPRVVQGGGLIRRVRSSQFQPGPDWAARVVVDLTSAAAYQVGWKNGTLRIKLQGFTPPPESAPAAEPAEAAPAPAEATPAAEPASPEPARKARKGAKAPPITVETKAEADVQGAAVTPAEAPLPGQAPPAPAPVASGDRRPDAAAEPQEGSRKAGSQFFLKVGPFASEDEMKTANGLISSLGYTAAPLRDKKGDGRSPGR